MKYRFLFVCLLLITSLSYFGCKKRSALEQDKEIDPCAGVFSESGPWTIGLKLVDKDTKENLLLKKAIDTAQIKIVNQVEQRIIPKFVYVDKGLVYFMVPEKTTDFKISVYAGSIDPILLTFSSTVKAARCGIDHQVKDMSVGNYPFVISEKTFRRYTLDIGI